jgi:ABC-type branched-subunit amino acid transport system substrate-binding protein
MILATQSYETTDATIDSQIASLRASGANVLFMAALPKFAAQAIRKVYDVGWNPTKFLIYSAASIAATMKPAGLEKGVGVITAGWLPDPTDPEVQNTPAYKEWLTWMNKYYPAGKYCRWYQFIWVRNFSGICRCAQKMWRQSHPRKRDEAGSQHL